ncbi:hypothetical protein MPL1_11773 [Methylophaga lonarensis MPL]|uniref:Uncharacterized protein n=1 Tax=Methylophaga lonarensis MPL TaxID=1286106 RepID=M7NY64_9GAMM|nr:DUF6494 family protein [Methylophaga lonarensis]EMR12156.1 hypothetical protein MPL1_11773 [Methylophaga lonarensis MPL]
MNEETLNMQIRQFLKQVGVSSQREIEQAIHNALDNDDIEGDESFNVKVTLSLPALNLHHEVSGTIKLD